MPPKQTRREAQLAEQLRRARFRLRRKAEVIREKDRVIKAISQKVFYISGWAGQISIQGPEMSYARRDKLIKAIERNCNVCRNIFQQSKDNLR